MDGFPLIEIFRQKRGNQFSMFYVFNIIHLSRYFAANMENWFAPAQTSLFVASAAVSPDTQIP